MDWTHGCGWEPVWGLGMRICGQNPQTDADATFQDLHISGLRRE